MRDLLWAWGNPEMAKEGEHTAATYADAPPMQRAALLGMPNVILAGHGLPDDDGEAEKLTAQAAGAPHLVWEAGADGEGEDRPFVYRQRMEQVRRLAERHPNLEGALLDDMSTVQIDRGFRPEHIRDIGRLLGETRRSVRIWGVLYTMSLGREGIGDYVRELDVINLWTWHARDVADLEKNVARCERLFPGKPIILGLYLYDYGDNRRMPIDLLAKQCEAALRLAHAGRVQGIVFLTITNDAEAVSWAADWVRRVGGQRLSPP